MQAIVNDRIQFTAAVTKATREYAKAKPWRGTTDEKAAKLQAFNRTAGLSIGSPILFSSVAHGSAHDIAGKGQADPGAMIEAITRLARVNAKAGDR